MASVTVTEARAALPELLNRVEGGDEVTITRHGRAVAVLVRPDALRTRRAGTALAEAARIHERIAAAATTETTGVDGFTAERAEDLIRAIRAERDVR
ncbi:MAG: type II toxin-antitoxin system Phd/YefM family antitoxin [Jatrophihabitans sp.]